MKALVLSAALSAALFGTITAADASWHYDMTTAICCGRTGSRAAMPLIRRTWLSAAGKRM